MILGKLLAIMTNICTIKLLDLVCFKMLNFYLKTIFLILDLVQTFITYNFTIKKHFKYVST